ncbi:portal protein [Bordetella trematum]|uniref:portal protein n=1 Tax=Bordetella trematum TaxID=123899 RepID=UPI003AF34FE4
MVESDLAKALIKRLSELRGARTTIEGVWKQCGDYSFPMRSQGFYGEEGSPDGAQTKQAELYDTTTTDSGKILASSIQTGTTPANARWFGLAVQDADDYEKKWLDDSAQRLWTAIHGGNFDAESMDGLLDLVAFGLFVFFVTEARDERGAVDGFRFELWPLSQCYCASSTESGLIDTVFRPYSLTVGQCVTQFGLDAVSPKVRDQYHDDKLDEKVKILHAVYPRPEGSTGSLRANRMPFASVYVEMDSRVVLKNSGFHEQPVMVPRWTRVPNSVYATGPMFEALPDAKALNKITQMELVGIDTAVSGMWIAEDDGVLNPRTVRVGPRKIIVANSVDSMKPLSTGTDFSVSFTKRADLSAQIRKIMMADQLPPMEGQPRTATEFYARLNMIRQLLGPVYGRMQVEFLQPLIHRCFGIALRAGLFAAPPDSLRDRTYTVVYLSPMAKSQKMEEVSAIDGGFARIANLAQLTGDPSVWDNVKRDDGVRAVLDGLGVPAALVNGEDEVAAIREQRAQQEQAAQQQAMGQALTMEAASAGINRMAQAQ